MNKYCKIVLALSTIGIIVGVVVVGYISDPWGLNTAGFYWEVEVGDSYVFLVEAMIDHPYNPEQEEDIYPSSYNGTILSVVVSFLPNLSSAFTRSQFYWSVINVIKVNWSLSNITGYTS